jgi:hypothetical protein
MKVYSGLDYIIKSSEEHSYEPHCCLAEKMPKTFIVILMRISFLCMHSSGALFALELINHEKYGVMTGQGIQQCVMNK